MTKVHAMWHGGANYSVGNFEYLEEFASLQAAARALRSRAEMGAVIRQTFHYANGRIESNFTPNADQDPSMTVWLCDPREIIDPYPDRIISFGPRGGLRIEKA